MHELRKEDAGSMAYVYLLTLVAALGGLLFGYDTAVISGAIGFLQAHFALDPQLWKGWAAASALIGCAVGAALAGMLSDRLGRKKVLVLSAIAFFISALGTAFPRSFAEFVAFRIVGGLGIGAASITSPLYIAEVSPARVRGRMVSVNQFAIVSGMVLVYFINYFIAEYGAALDRQRIAEHVRASGPALDAQAAQSFVAAQLSANGSPLRRISAKAFSDRAAWGSEAVVDLLAQQGVAVDKIAVELAGRKLTPWNVERGWRWMFGSGTLPALVLLVLLFAVPESPRWLAKQERPEEALGVLSRISGARQAAVELAAIHDAIARESGSLGQLLQPRMRIVLVIGVALAVLQQVTGINVFLYYAPEIFKKMGSQTQAALLQTVLVGTVNFAFTIAAIWTVDRWGRKPLMLIGATGMGLALTAMGWAAYYQRTELWVLMFILGYIACFALSVGPVTWVILSEIFPTRIRGRAMAIATVCLWIANYVVTQTFTLIDENQWLVERFHHGFAFWLYALLCGVQLVVVWYLVPETKGQTLEEIERGWLGDGR